MDQPGQKGAPGHLGCPGAAWSVAYIGSGQLPIRVVLAIGSGQLPIAESVPVLVLMGSGQLPIARVLLLMGSGQLPMALTDSTAGAAAENAKAPAKATEAAIFLNMWVPQYESEIRFGKLQSQHQPLLTYIVKLLAQRLSSI